MCFYNFSAVHCAINANKSSTHPVPHPPLYSPLTRSHRPSWVSNTCRQRKSSSNPLPITCSWLQWTDKSTQGNQKMKAQEDKCSIKKLAHTNWNTHMDKSGKPLNGKLTKNVSEHLSQPSHFIINMTSSEFGETRFARSLIFFHRYLYICFT